MNQSEPTSFERFLLDHFEQVIGDLAQVKTGTQVVIEPTIRNWSQPILAAHQAEVELATRNGIFLGTNSPERSAMNQKAIEEVARIKDTYPELTDDLLDYLNDRLAQLQEGTK